MKKNLKKVISAVIALALSASTFASVSFAKSFTDVASTASYAEAVDVLSALGIINGYEDGTFGPDKTITRAEAAKMIVAMVNKIATAEGRMGATKFEDVTADHEWATGYINVGVTDGFINGRNDTTFDPQGEVKYNEIVKMIVSCLGYEEYAQFYGGYPAGYISIADSEGITKGCSMDGEAAATRAVVAQLIYNALKTPVIQNKGMQYSATQGGFVPNIEKQDGEESKYYKTLLTEKFDAYLVEGMVTETKKTNDALDADMVKFDVQKSENYDEEVIMESANDAAGDEVLDVNVGDTAAADYLNTYANAIIQVNEDDEYEFISFVPSGKNKVAALDLALIDDEKYDKDEILKGLNNANPYIYVYSSEDSARSTKYKLEKDFTLYVNGVKINSVNDEDYEKYIINNHVGVMELTDTYKTADGYDIVSVEYYDTTKVTSTSAKNIYIRNESGVLGTSISIDAEKLEDDEITMNVYMDGEKINASEIKKDDIISIKYNVEKGKDSSFFDIYVSRETVEGKFSGRDTENETVKIAGENYSFVDWSKDNKIFATDKMGSEFIAYTDVFGRIYTAEESVATAKYAVILRYVNQTGSWDNDGLRLYFTDGTYKNVEFANSVKVTIKKAANKTVADLKKELTYNTDTGSSTDATAANIQDRIVKYTINTSNKISKIEILKKSTNKTSEYDSRNTKIGSIVMNSTTTIINSSEFDGTASKLSAETISNLANGVEYTAYAFGDASTTDSSYPFVLITSGAGAYTEETSFAVVTKDMYESIKDDGEEGNTLEVLYTDSDEVQELFVDEDATWDKEPVAGDVVVFQTNADGDIKEIKVIYRGENFGKAEFKSNYDAFTDDIDLPGNSKWEKAWTPENDIETSLVFGPIVERNNRKFFAQVKDCKTTFDVEPTKGEEGNEGATIDIITTDDTNVYVYDINNAKNDRFYVGTVDDIVATQVEHATALNTETGNYEINWKTITEADDQINLAFAKVVDGVVTDIFVIVGAN